MIFKLIRGHLIGTINRVGWWERTINRGEFSLHQSFDEKMLLNSSWYLTVSSINFILYNDLTLNNCFQQINQLINIQMEKELSELS